RRVWLSLVGEWALARPPVHRVCRLDPDDPLSRFPWATRCSWIFLISLLMASRRALFTDAASGRSLPKRSKEMASSRRVELLGQGGKPVVAPISNPSPVLSAVT